MTHAGKALIDPHIVFEKVGLAAGMRVADLGCGRTGHFVFPASRVVGDSGVVYAIDIVKNILESIKSRIRSEGYDNVQTVWSNLELLGSTPIPAESLDACFLVNVLFLVNDKTVVLQEAKRLLKKGGSIILVDWEKKLGPLGPGDEQRIPKEAARNLLQQLGFAPQEDFFLSDYHYCLIFKKV